MSRQLFFTADDVAEATNELESEAEDECPLDELFSDCESEVRYSSEESKSDTIQNDEEASMTRRKQTSAPSQRLIHDTTKRLTEYQKR